MSKFIKVAKVKSFSTIKELCDYLFERSTKLSGDEMVELFYQFNSDHNNIFNDIRVTRQANHKVINFIDLAFQEENRTIGINTHHIRGGQTFPYAGKELSKFLLKAFFLREKTSGSSSSATTEVKKTKTRKRANAKFRLVVSNRWEIL
jgi:hypothetical protein